jgi:hypothetical protein
MGAAALPVAPVSGPAVSENVIREMQVFLAASLQHTEEVFAPNLNEALFPGLLYRKREP